MRIAIIQPRTPYYVAGSEKVSLKHAEHLSRLGHIVDFYTSIPSVEQETFLFKEFNAKRLENVNMLRFDIGCSIPGLYNEKPDTDHVRWITESIAFDEKIYGAINQNKPDVILSYYLPDNLFKPAGIPNVLYLSGYSSKSIPWYKSFARFCNATISISSAVSEKWDEYLTDSIHRYSLGTGVDYPLVIRDEIKKTTKYNLVFAGRFIERKGVMTLIDAFKEILEAQNNIHLWLLGDGELFNSVKKRIADLKIESNVSLTGLVQNPYDYFAMSDICIFPSHEGDGLMGTVLESMAAGKPVITTKHNGNEDVITSGVNGILIEPKNTRAIVDAVLDLVKSDAMRMDLGHRAELFVAENVAWEKNVLKLTEILEEIVEKSGKRI